MQNDSSLRHDLLRPKSVPQTGNSSLWPGQEGQLDTNMSKVINKLSGLVGDRKRKWQQILKIICFCYAHHIVFHFWGLYMFLKTWINSQLHKSVKIILSYLSLWIMVYFICNVCSWMNIYHYVDNFISYNRIYTGSNN